jgi:hypothetical protein
LQKRIAKNNWELNRWVKIIFRRPLIDMESFHTFLYHQYLVRHKVAFLGRRILIAKSAKSVEGMINICQLIKIHLRARKIPSNHYKTMPLLKSNSFFAWNKVFDFSWLRDTLLKLWIWWFKLILTKPQKSSIFQARKKVNFDFNCVWLFLSSKRPLIYIFSSL